MIDRRIESTRLKIERERLRMDQRREMREGNLFNRHLGALITTVVAIAAAIVSYAQLEVAEVNKSKEIKLNIVHIVEIK